MDINGKTSASGNRGPFDVERLSSRATYQQANWPVLWSHDNQQERTLIVLPCSSGQVRAGMGEKARRLWNGYTHQDGEAIAPAGRLHINRDFQLNAQPLGACLNPST